MKSALVFVYVYLFVCAIIPLIRKLAFAFNILDHPGGRKVHKAPTPLLGGVAIFLGFACGFLFNFTQLYFLMPVFLGALIIFVVGLLNDIRELSVRVRLFFQILASLVVMSSGMRISFLPNTLWGNITEVVITLIWIVGLTNAFNYLDGLDGLAAGSCIINLLAFIAILYMTGQYPMGLLAIILIAGCAAFLPYNFEKKIFLGDSGSTFLGFMLACFSFTGHWAGNDIVKISIPILILGVPIFDMVFTTIVRIKEGNVKTVLEWLRYSGKDHFHHSLVELGLSPRAAVFFIYCATFSLGLSAIMVSNDSVYEAFLSLAQSFIIFAIIGNLIIAGKRHCSGWGPS
ncbi:MAG: MraY family glycosyltransferase [Candidatus Omnitrophica bacterium]|nr:MraY family glycosyltransferase [Candidatus Omnitrophota bacterium]